MPPAAPQTAVLSAGLLLAAASVVLAATFPRHLAGCNFEDSCPWGWNNSRLVTGQEVNNTWVPGDSALQGPFADADNNTHGHFLYSYLKRGAGGGSPSPVHVWSRHYGKPSETCRLIFWYHMHNMSDGHIRVIIAVNNTQSIVSERYGNDNRRWQNYSVNVGGIKQEFSIILEFVPGSKFPLHIAVDNIILKNCFPDPPHNVCLPSHFQCSDGTCIERTQVCNINKDCEDGGDEFKDCDEVPDFARCSFEDGMCGWHNGVGNHMNWTLNNGSTPTQNTGPTADHTFKNASGMYVFVEMTGNSMGSASQLESPIIYPPPRYHSNISSPYYNSCWISFYYHKFGPHSGSLGLFIVELQENVNRSTKVWWSFGDKGNKWLRNYVILPNVTNRYYLQFEARKGVAARGDPAIDDIAMSPKCFGFGVPKEHLDGYDYNNPFPSLEPTPEPTTHMDFVNSTYYKFSTCGKIGRYGPSPEECSMYYNNTPVQVNVMTQKTMAGIQQWTVPETGYYTIIGKGASGGKGSDGIGISWGAMARTVTELRKGTKVYILVGQEGNSACLKTFSSNKKTVCQSQKSYGKPLKEKLKEITQMMYLPEGGGGGGGTFVFTWDKDKRPLLIAGGGGGLAHKSSHTSTIHAPDIAIQHGKKMNGTLAPITGEQYGFLSAGAGGGWRRANYTHSDATGFALTQGGNGGQACYESNDGSDMGAGGFGGGGGGCTAGGGGGGYTGGRAWAQKGAYGEGGYSWITTGMMQKVGVPGLPGPGEVTIIPAISGCSCEFRCVALDIHRAKVLCICPEEWHLANDSISCVTNKPHKGESSMVILMTCSLVVFIFLMTLVCCMLYNRYRKKKEAKARQMAAGADLQLNRLRVASDSMMTEYNPNYEFGGGVYSLRDLKEIPREHLRLVKALGQGAFGEVYQGFFKHRAGDAVEMPVAVKTLPELSTNQAETDFLMEALIMSKFNHPNIVHFIGVCFDKHPRFIVIELLAGGDLKTFLRESRPKPDRASPLTMTDLLRCIVDVAKGCKYMEENRFIHRDIAARNCLLTTKGPGRVVKIADFGMARDIYRADYYRKGGKAMLPIKWMPPEAFLDGIFTTKTDVWSFGVLMWEVMSLGYMPYTGCANREVMSLVTSGGRLEPPTNCPSQIYAIMTQCWHPNPDERPSFCLILERLDYCMQDPDVTRAPLPVYAKPPSSERDTTIMRPTGQEECIHPDYLVPLSGPQDWDFANPLPESRSSQPLLENEECAGTGSPITTTNNNNPLAPIPEKQPFHGNHIHPESDIFIVSQNLKVKDAEISC